MGQGEPKGGQLVPNWSHVGTKLAQVALNLPQVGPKLAQGGPIFHKNAFLFYVKRPCGLPHARPKLVFTEKRYVWQLFLMNIFLPWNWLKLVRVILSRRGGSNDGYKNIKWLCKSVKLEIMKIRFLKVFKYAPWVHGPKAPWAPWAHMGPYGPIYTQKKLTYAKSSKK